MNSKNKDKIYNISIITLTIAIVIVFSIRFVFKKDSVGFEIIKPKEINLIGKSGLNIALNNVLLNGTDNYFLFLEIDNCGTCIYKGVQEVKYLQKKGNNCHIVVINDYPKEIEGWIQNLNFSSVFVLKKEDFYKFFKCSYLPVLILIKDLKVASFRYITY